MADVDGDGDLDIMAEEQESGIRDELHIVWYENIDGKGMFDLPKVMATGPFIQLLGASPQTRGVIAADIDGDGDIDLVSQSPYHASDETFAWHENTEARGVFETRVISDTDADNLSAIPLIVDDFDGDDDMDILASYNWELFLFENSNGRGEFARGRFIGKPGAFIDSGSFVATDVDSDGDLDVIANGYGGHLLWYENKDDGRVSAEPRVIGQNEEVLCWP